MITIYKYELPITESSILELLCNFKFLSFKEKLVNVHEITAGFWAIVDNEAKLQPVKFEIRESGQNAVGLDMMKYIGTFRRLTETFHVFMDNDL